MIKFIALLALFSAHDTQAAHTPEKVAKGSIRARKLSLSAGTETNSYSLDETGCTAPSAEGGWGYCGPESCRENYSTCSSAGGGVKTVDGVTGDWNSYYSGGSNCATYLTNDVTPITDWSPKGSCDSTCTQVTSGVCSSEFLANALKGFGVKYAYCNDEWLHIIASGETGGMYTENLNDTPYPPAAGSDFSMRTGMDTLDTSRTQELYFPLNPTALSTSEGTNNYAVYDEQSGAGAFSYLINNDGDSAETYALPADGGIGMAVNGMPIFPVYNNNARYTPQKCEVDSCNEHVGQGGGAAHYHGDPYADDWDCLYGKKNYTSVDDHPPLIGFAYDGYLIYGRYLSESAPGYNDPALDTCGGHAHNSAGSDTYGFDLTTYHYHAQIFDGTVPSSGAIATAGEAYVVTVPGPYQCYKADLTASSGSSALLQATASSTYKAKNEMSHRCCDMSDYYMLTGNTFPDTASYSSASTCTAPTSITNGAYSDCTGTMLSGHACTPTCISGYTASGDTTCIGGTLTEATCVESSGDDTASTPSPTPADDGSSIDGGASVPQANLAFLAVLLSTSAFFAQLFV
ncbi:hypothetical protein TrST_g9924 [Triparma strigata]|uniref:YHYH domain-containing protein n=1 Tax=Triparma strigata TaxID=1606541 RepID=A0A9W7E047_9STRA|nr:hypothetical protein TrST_g9924 [Triparma strigata]